MIYKLCTDDINKTSTCSLYIISVYYILLTSTLTFYSFLYLIREVFSCIKFFVICTFILFLLTLSFPILILVFYGGVRLLLF